MRLKIFVTALLLSIAVSSEARSAHAKYEFRKANPCPATGKTSGSCPGYIVDHIYPLCAGGIDKASNMQWQHIEESKQKDRWEVHLCRTGEWKR